MGMVARVLNKIRISYAMVLIMRYDTTTQIPPDMRTEFTKSAVIVMDQLDRADKLGPDGLHQLPTAIYAAQGALGVIANAVDSGICQEKNDGETDRRFREITGDK